MPDVCHILTFPQKRYIAANYILLVYTNQKEHVPHSYQTKDHAKRVQISTNNDVKNKKTTQQKTIFAAIFII